LAYQRCVEGNARGVIAAGGFDFKALHASFGGAYVTSNNYSRELAMRAVSTGHADMVALGHPFVGNPYLVVRLRDDRSLFVAPPEAY